MGEREVPQQFRALVGTRKKVQLTRSLPSEPRHNGFVVAVGHEGVLLQQFHDFYPEGYTTLRVGDITCRNAARPERFLWGPPCRS